ncbi:MAG: HlyC/CorC family transporter [Dehalococcoidia bacterium]|nr:HlyC/CorC family transporter [Dehalococcoidia bacterium]
MLSIGGGLLAVLALVLVNGFFVAAEYAIVTVRRTRVAQLVAEGALAGRTLEHAVGRLDSYIATCQLGVTIASLALGWIGEPALAGLLDPVFGRASHPAAVALAFIAITTVTVVAGELAPKNIALRYAERVALIVVLPLRVFRALFRPVIWLLTEAGWAVAGVFGVRRDALEASSASAAELRLIVEHSAAAGQLGDDERLLLGRVLRFGELRVGDVMVPRTEVLAIALDTAVVEAVRFVAEHHHSRYPVYRESVDDVIGVLHARDLLRPALPGTLEALLRQPLMVPAQASVAELLEQMREHRTHFAIAVDEYGGTDGIVTLEDVLEQIVGELRDEFEPVLPAAETRPGVLRIDGLDAVEVLAERLSVTVEPGPYNTVAGYVLERIGRIPHVGDAVELDGYSLTVVEMDDLRVAAVEASPAPRRRIAPGARAGSR